jgi:hypothetical protein
MTPEEEIRHLRSLVVLLAQTANLEELPASALVAVVAELERSEGQLVEWSELSQPGTEES